MKNIKKSKNEEMNKKEKKWENKKQEKNGRKKSRKKMKRGPKGVCVVPSRAQKLIFHVRTVKRNRNEIEAQKNQILSTQQNERK